MQLSPLCLVFAAGLGTFAIGQAVLPTAHAQAAAHEYHVAVKNLHTAHTKSGLETTGEITNTGSEALMYTSVVLVFRTAAGAEAAVPAYLTTGPVGPGQSAMFRSASPEITYASVSVRLREAGRSVTVTSECQNPDNQNPDNQKPDKRRTTVR